MTPTPSTVRTTVTVTTTLLSADQRNRGIPELGQLHNMRHVYGPVHPLQVLPGNSMCKRPTTVSPTAIPTYASACPSLAAYSSACSCLGVRHTTITATAATSTSVMTTTETSTPSLPTPVASTSNSRSYSNSTTSTGISAQNSTSSSSTATSSPTATLDTTCGETATPFSLRVAAAQSGSPFDGWWARLSGDGVLFTSEQSGATRFSVEGSGHLCAVGAVGELGNAVIAVVTNLTDSGAVWLLDARWAEAFAADYVPVQCQTAGGALACAAGLTRNWVGCGLQLGLSSEQGSVVVDGLNCSAIGLEVV